MKKLIKLDFNNITRERKTEDSYSELYSHDKNNGSFEFEILNDTLTTEQVIALFKFTESNKIWKTTGTVEGNKVNVTFDTSLITQNETVICYLYFDEEQRTSDTFRFKFKVKVSEIDKMNRYEVKERFINNTVIVDRLDVVTKDELKEALKNVGGIATEGLLTEVKAEELYAKKSEAVDNTNFELVKNRVLALELKTDKDTVYDDSELKGRISVLEAKEDNNTIYDDTNVRERLTALESKPNVDVNNLVTKDELASKNYLTKHQDTSNFALKSEIPQQYNDTEVKERLTTLENKAPVDLSNYATKEELHNISGSQSTVDNLVTKEELEAKHFISDVSNLATKEELQEVRNSQPTVDTSHLVTRDELESKGYLTTHQDLSEYAKKSELYNDSDLRNRVVTLETKEDKDTKYDDTEVKHRLTELENKPAVDTSFFVTEEKLNSKGYISDISGLATKQELANAVTKDELEAKHYVTEEELNNKAYLTQQNLDNYALKSELPTPYNDSLLNERVTALESKAIEGGAYDDTDLRNRVINLENKPALDTSEFVTNQALESRGYIKDVSNLVTKDELQGKHYISDISNLVTKEELENKGYLKTHQNLDNVVTKEELATKGYITDVSNLVTKEELESKNYLTTPYNDTPLKERVEALENKIDKDTIYNDTELRNRVEVLENKPNVDLSNYVTSEQLENKHYLTQHQELTHLATTSDLEALRNIAVSKSELSKKLDTTEFNSFKDNVVTKTELAEKGYISDLSNYVTKEELHEATEIDYSNIVTTDELEGKHYLTANDISNLATKVELQDKVNKSDFDTLKADVIKHNELAERHYLTEPTASETYAKKSEIPTPYNDSELVSRVSALESKQDKDTVYNDTEVKQRLTALENRPTTGGGLSTEDVATYTNNIIYVPNGNIVYDKNVEKLYIPKCNVKVGKTNYWCEAQEVTINGSAGFIVFNKAQKRIVGGDVNTTNDVLLGYYDNNIGNYYLNTFSKAFKKKKIACLGDSITEGVNANGWQWHRYIDKYFKENGVETTIVNLGIGGTSVCTSSYVTASLQPFVNRLNTIPTDTDVIVIFGGTNDWGNNATLGTISDTGSSSFYGAYKYMLEWFAINRPNAKILTITPLKRYFRGNTTTWVNAQTTRNNKGQLLQDYVRAVKEVSEMYAIPCVDLHNESGLNPVLEIVRTKYMGDGLHPTAEGNKKMYPIILNKLKPLVKYD